MPPCKPRKKDLPHGFEPTSSSTWILRRANTGEGFLWQSQAHDDPEGQLWHCTADGWASEPRPNALPDEVGVFDVPANVAMWVCGFPEDEVLQRLRATGDGEPDEHDWAFSTKQFESQDDEFPGSWEAQARRYLCVGGRRVQFAEPSGAPFLTQNGAPMGVTLATFRWGSEDGMMSGASSWTLTQVSPNRAIASADGDATAPPVEMTLSSERLAEAVASWLADVEGGAIGVPLAAAIELEPFDPADELPDAERRSWESLLADLRSGYGTTLECTVALDGDDREHLRNILAEDDEYRAIRDALANPAKHDEWLRAQLQQDDPYDLDD